MRAASLQTLGECPIVKAGAWFAMPHFQGASAFTWMNCLLSHEAPSESSSSLHLDDTHVPKGCQLGRATPSPRGASGKGQRPLSLQFQ